MKANVDANLFRLVNTVTSKEATRYYLNGVLIEPHPDDGAMMVATDGHRMLVAHDPEGACDGPMIVKLPLFALAQCKPPAMFGAKRKLEIEITSDNLSSAKIVSVTPSKNKDDFPTFADLMTAYAIHIDGKFPDWRKVVPTPDNTTTGILAYNAKCLRDIAAMGIEVAKTLGTGNAFIIEQSDPGSPSIIRWSGVDNLFGVIMAMRFDSKYTKLPQFMNQQPMAAAAE